MNFVIVKKTVLRPDPDEGSSPTADANVGDIFAVTRELKPWVKGKLTSGNKPTSAGWLMFSALGEAQSEPFDIYDEPEGAKKSIRGEIGRTIVNLAPWRKVEVALADGSAIAGWILATADVGGVEPGDPPQHPSADPSSTLELGVNEIYRAALMLAQARTGIDAAAIAALINAEAAKLPGGQWNKDSRATTSSASGLTQFLNATWLGEAKKPRTFLNERAKERGYVTATNAVAPGREDDLLALRFDPELSIVAAAEYGSGNLNALIKAGLVEADIGNDEKARFIYLAHYEGLGGAQAFLRGTVTYSFGDVATPSRPE